MVGLYMLNSNGDNVNCSPSSGQQLELTCFESQPTIAKQTDTKSLHSLSSFLNNSQHNSYLDANRTQLIQSNNLEHESLQCNYSHNSPATSFLLLTSRWLCLGLCSCGLLTARALHQRLHFLIFFNQPNLHKWLTFQCVCGLLAL